MSDFVAKVKTIKDRLSGHGDKFVENVTDPLNSFFDWFNEKYRNTKFGLQNIKYWYKIIWEDRNWDYYFIYVIFHKKIQLMEEHINEHANHVTYEKDVKTLRKTREALERLMKDDYFEIANKKVVDRFGEIEVTSEGPNDRGLFTCNFIRKNLDYSNEEDVMIEREMTKKAADRAEQLKNRDLNIVFGTMRKHIQGWWD